MFCPTCGQEALEQTNFCQYCGHPLHPEAQDRLISTAPLCRVLEKIRRLDH